MKKSVYLFAISSLFFSNFSFAAGPGGNGPGSGTALPATASSCLDTYTPIPQSQLSAYVASVINENVGNDTCFLEPEVKNGQTPDQLTQPSFSEQILKATSGSINNHDGRSGCEEEDSEKIQGRLKGSFDELKFIVPIDPTHRKGIVVDVQRDKNLVYSADIYTELSEWVLQSSADGGAPQAKAGWGIQAHVVCEPLSSFETWLHPNPSLDFGG